MASPLVRCRMEVERQLGFALSTDQASELDRLVNDRARKLRLTPAEYAARWSGVLAGEALGLAGHFTISESFFFRDLAQLRLCRDVIEERLREHLGRPIRILSAGCATGEEPYSLLMLLLERVASDVWLEVVALDISATSLEHARRGSYSGWALRETPSDYQQRWFERDGSSHRLSREITGRVHFVRGSLCTPPHELARQSFDVILCRNVLMYFAPAEYRRAASRLVDCLRPGGSLFLGHAESLRGLGLPVTLIAAGDSFRYQRQAQPPAPSLRVDEPAPTGTPEPESESVATRVDRGDAPTTLAAGLELSWEAPLPVANQNSLVRAFQSFGPVAECLREERFGDALKALEACPTDPSAVFHLCRALLLVYTNQVDDARTAAGLLLGIEGVAAGAQYVLGLCHELESDWQSARACALSATYLDPTFAMAWLHLGMLSLRVTDRSTARKELMHARALLMVEHPVKLLWFGAGCSRTALVAACHRELQPQGATP